MSARKKRGNIVTAAVAALFLLMGTVTLISGISLSIQIKNSSEVKAEIVDISEKTKRKRQAVGYNNVTVYAPVYEYVYNGEKKHYESTVFSSEYPRLGSSETLYILKNGSVADKAAARSRLASGIGGVVLGGVLIIICARRRE